MKKRIEFSYSFSSEDVLAIVAALPLVPAFGADTELQQSINEHLCLSAMDKLIGRQPTLTPNEIRVIALSISLAKDILAGYVSFAVDPETLVEIRPHIFTYNRLDAIFDPLTDQMMAQLDK